MNNNPTWTDEEMVEFAGFYRVQNQMQVFDAQKILELFKKKKERKSNAKYIGGFEVKEDGYCHVVNLAEEKLK